MSAATASTSASPRHITWKRGFWILTFVCFGFLLQGASYSHLTSFFDIYGFKEKALSSTEYGIIMGSYCLVMVIASPLIAKIINLKYFQDKTLMFIAWIIDATFSLILSFAYKLEPGNPFFLGCLTLRILEACGCAVGFIMPYVITGSEMSEYSHIVIPLLETIYGTSVVAGPAISGVLYDLGGFPLPFRVLGGMLMFLMILAIILYPKAEQPYQEEETTENVSVWSALEFPVFVNALCTVSAFISVSSNESTLAMQLNSKFGMNATDAGLVFLYPGGFYAVSSLLLGFLSKSVSDPRVFVLFGQLISLVALVIQGPLIPIEQTKTMFLLAQVLLGVGAGPSLACAYLHSLRYLSNGKETKEIHAALSAIFIPAAMVGITIGPFVAGVVRHHFSYEAVVATSALQACLTAILLLITACVARKTSKKTERT